ncbi:Separin [Termitomyces sp. J132]|nr:Separin [Termitomyces sp. J132]
MRVVNSASQQLSAAVQSGWKKSSNKGLTQVTTAAATAAQYLAMLRRNSSGDVNIERVAMTVLGKLVSLELYDEAFSALEVLHSRLCNLLNVAQPQSCARNHLIQIPFPASEIIDPTLLTLTLTYLAYSLTILTNESQLSPRNSKEASANLDALSDVLDGKETSFLAWIPRSSSMLSKQLDSLLTRAYTALTKACISCKATPRSIFSLRMYAVTCLAYTSVGTVESTTFWDQVVRFGAAFVKSQEVGEEAMHAVLAAFTDLVSIVEKRDSASHFLSGRGFVGFCEYWLVFAKRGGDVCLVDRIACLIQGISMIPSLSGKSSQSQDIVPLVESDQQMSPRINIEHDTLAAARLCATFAQANTAIEQKSPDMAARIREAFTMVKGSPILLRLLKVINDDSADYVRIRGKLDRALERLRRVIISAFDSSTSQQIFEDPLYQLLEEIFNILKQQCTFPNTDMDILTRTIDTLFVLARTRLIPSDPRTYIAAHNLLTEATSILELHTTDLNIDTPNYLRCISGAFHNLAGTLYQAGRYGPAIGFLKDACSLGIRALESHGKSAPSDEGKAAEGWKQLEEQLYRRWELLGVCYLKNGDRKQAWEAFQHCVQTFPYAACGFSERTRQVDFSAIFDLSTGTKQLASIIDRITNLSTCDLLMEPSAVSLNSIHVDDDGIIGVVLERQVKSLESIRYNENVSKVISHLLGDTLKVYGSDMPVRRARILVKCLELMYHSGPDVISGIGSPDDIGAEIEDMFQTKDYGKDLELSSYVSQYRVATHLWLALHAHRRMDNRQNEFVAHHSEEACRLLKIMLGTSEFESVNKKLPKQTNANAPKNATLGPLTRQHSTRKDRSVREPSRGLSREPVTPKSKSRKALQPMSLNTDTLPRRINNGGTLVVLDGVERLVSLLRFTARMNGILGEILSKINLLNVLKRFCDSQLGKQSDGHITSSVDLACEYAKLGKTRRATMIFSVTLDTIRSGRVSVEASVYFYLRYAESLAMTEELQKSVAMYYQALNLSEASDLEDKGLPVNERIRARVKRVEMAAIASHVYALIQYSMGDVPATLHSMLQALRLWNRAADSLLQLPHPKKTFPRRNRMDGLEWRISEGLAATLFSLSEIYLSRGSAREAEYFAQQAYDLAESLNAPTLTSRALAKKGEIQLYQGHLDASLECLTAAAALLQNQPGVENIDVQRLRGAYSERMAHRGDAGALYDESLNMIEELNQAFHQIDNLVFGRKSIGSSPVSKVKSEALLPGLCAAVLRHRIWLLRDGNVQDYSELLDKFLLLPHSSRIKSEEKVLLAKLTLHAVYGRFRADMFLSSLTESTIALPMGMTSGITNTPLSAAQDILVTLEAAEKLFWECLVLITKIGRITDVREAGISLALVQAFRTSLGKSNVDVPNLTASLLDASAAITLRREMLETIRHKFPPDAMDDIKWPLLVGDGSPQPQTNAEGGNARFSFTNSLQSADKDDTADPNEASLKEYWDSVRERHQARMLDPSALSSSQVGNLPSNWTVVHINVTEDKTTLFITRQECGSPTRTPLIFCVPLKGRRDNGNNDEDEEQHLTFEDAVEELNKIVKLSDEGTKSAVHVKTEDQKARAAWWKQRAALDTRLRELLRNVEFCWLGEIKTILTPRSNLTPDLIADLRAQIQKVFHRGLHVQDKKAKFRGGTHKKNASQTQNPVASQVTFDDALLECFSTLSPKCRDEELEDLVYFILDLYQFHGVPVAIAEVDIFQVVLELRVVLEDHVQRLARRKIQKTDDEHLFLVLDKNLQGLPWESIPVLRGRSVSRIPSVDFLHDRVLFAEWKRKTFPADNLFSSRGAFVDPRKGYYILNPSGDLDKTEARFKGWAVDMEKVGWHGISGYAPSEQQFLNALQSQDLVVYFGHGGGEQYIRSHKIRNLSVCAATMLWGCSSGALREMGDFDRVGTPFNYMLAGSPCLVANLWDVTDKDIDKFSQAVFDKLGLTADGIKDWGRQDGQISIIDAERMLIPGTEAELLLEFS